MSIKFFITYKNKKLTSKKTRAFYNTHKKGLNVSIVNQLGSIAKKTINQLVSFT